MTLRGMLRSPEHRLAFWRSVCGCHAGALAVLIALGWLVVRLAHGADLTLLAALRGAGLVLGAGVSAKLAAIAAARMLYVVDGVLTRRAGRVMPGERVGA